MQDSSGHGGARPGAGRPRRAPTLAAAMRESFPIEEIIAMVKQNLASASDEIRFRTLIQIIERCHGKVTDKLEIAPGTPDTDDEQLAEQLTDAQLDALDRLDEQRATILAGAVLALPSAASVRATDGQLEVLDGERHGKQR